MPKGPIERLAYLSTRQGGRRWLNPVNSSPPWRRSCSPPHRRRARKPPPGSSRGAAGLTTGVLEIPGNIVQQTRERGALGVPIGLGRGLGMFVARELVGAYELLTAPFPLPASYKPIVSPEYPWSYFVVTAPSAGR